MNEKFDKLMDTLPALLAAYGMNLLAAIALLIVGFIAAGWLGRMTTRTLQRYEKIDPIFPPLVGKTARIAVIVFTLIAVLNRFGVQTASLIAVLGAAGLAVGLALQGTLSNVAAGVMILVFRPFKIGDAVRIEGDVYVIDGIGLFLCNAHLPDGPSAHIPNSKIWGQTLVNLSVTDGDIRRIDETYGIAYDDDINVALAILNAVAAEEPRVLKDPAPLIAVESLGDSAVNILFRVWTGRADWWATKLDLLKRCKEALEAGGCSIPFPQRDVHMIQTAARPAS
jgi:small conductance mechanosensitive channel